MYNTYTIFTKFCQFLAARLKSCDTLAMHQPALQVVHHEIDQIRHYGPLVQ